MLPNLEDKGSIRQVISTSHQMAGGTEKVPFFKRTSALIALNGSFVAVATFAFLLFMTRDLISQESHNLTRDLVKSTQQEIATNERALHALGDYFSSHPISTINPNDINILLPQDKSFTEIYWTDDQGVWHSKETTDTVSKIVTPLVPKTKEIERAIKKLGDISYDAVFVTNAPEILAKDKSFVLVLKNKLKANPVYGPSLNLAKKNINSYVVVLATPDKFFGNSWLTEREELLGVRISDRETGEVLLSNNRNSQERLSSDSADYMIEAGGKIWDMIFLVQPTRVSSMLTALPWVMMLIIATMSLLTAMFVDRKERQERKLAEVTRTLEGASMELKTRINERDQLFVALRKSEREYRAVINSVSDVIFETDERGRLVFLNETWKRISGMEVAETMKMPLFDFIEEKDRLKHKDMFQELLSGLRQAYRIETNLVLANGARKLVEIAFSMMRMAEDKSIRVVGTITDIEKRRKAETALRDAEQKYRAIVENSISGIYQTSMDGKFISANPALASVLGYQSSDELISSIKNISEQIYARPQDREAFTQKLEKEGLVSGLESQLRKKDGSFIWIMENARAIRDASGKIAYCEGSITDITERRKMEEQLREAKMMAELSGRSKMEFLANMSHELRTPLNAIIGFSEIIKEEVMGPLGEPSYKEYAKDIFESGHHLLKILSEILELSRIETGDRELNESNFKLKKIVKSCITIMGNKIEHAGLKFEITASEDLPEILGEELAFKQIMLNILSNSVKFTPKGGFIRLGAQMNDAGEMVVEITDTGVGMTKEELERAMKPFGQVETAFDHQKSGTGLGITIVNALVALHQAKFELVSEKNKGTTARLTIPQKRILAPLKQTFKAQA